MRTPSWASTIASSTSGTSVTQTGHPGPMMTFRSRGRTARSPNLAIACSWLPHTCITDTGLRPISAVTRASAADSACALAGSRNRSSLAPSVIWSSGIAPLFFLPPARGDLAAHVRRHHVVFGFLEEQLVQRQRLADLVGGDLADRKAHVIQDVVARHHRLVHDVQPRLAAHAEEVHGRGLSVHLDDPARNAQTHDPALLSVDGGLRGGRQLHLQAFAHQNRRRVQHLFLGLGVEHQAVRELDILRVSFRRRDLLELQQRSLDGPVLFQHQRQPDEQAERRHGVFVLTQEMRMHDGGEGPRRLADAPGSLRRFGELPVQRLMLGPHRCGDDHSGYRTARGGCLLRTWAHRKAYHSSRPLGARAEVERNSSAGFTWRQYSTARSTRNGTCGSRSSLVSTTVRACWNIFGYLTGLSSPSVTENSTTFALSPRSQLAGQTRLPTFSMNSRSVASRSIASSAVSICRASRWQAPAVMTAWTSRSVCRARRSASFWVCTSPVITLSTSSWPRSASVRSSRSVLPAPGDETRFSAGTCDASRRSRTCSASSSSLAMIRSRTSIVRTAIVHLQIREAQHRTGPAQDQRTRAPKRRLIQQRLQTELEVPDLYPGVVADLDADGAHRRECVRAEALLGHAADLERQAELMHAPEPPAVGPRDPTPPGGA